MSKLLSPIEQAEYWDSIAAEYCQMTRISENDFHYGPLIPGDNELQLLPRPLTNIKALELGCGAGQNSIYLARHGANCQAVDVSEFLLQQGRELAATTNTTVKFARLAMEDIDRIQPEQFDLIHSSYAMPFVTKPAQLMQQLAALLLPGGCFIFSTVHPLFAGEWLELDGEDGLFLADYYRPPADCRYDNNGRILAVSRAYPISQLTEWLYEAGLRVERLLEPLPIKSPPYHSAAWEALRPRLEHIPATVIIKAVKSS